VLCYEKYDLDKAGTVFKKEKSKSKSIQDWELVRDLGEI
jgi:hypothetical protein